MGMLHAANLYLAAETLRRNNLIKTSLINMQFKHKVLEKIINKKLYEMLD